MPPVYLEAADKCPLCFIHGAMMIIAFQILMTFGFFLSRYVKPYASWWFPLHIFIMLTSFITFVVSIIIAAHVMEGMHVGPKYGGPNGEYVNVHHIMGYTTLALFSLQILVGTLAHFLYNPKRTRPPIVPDITHWVLGYTTLISADVTTYLGIYVMKMPTSYYVLLAAWIAFVAISFFSMELLVRVFKPTIEIHKNDNIINESTTFGSFESDGEGVEK